MLDGTWIPESQEVQFLSKHLKPLLPQYWWEEINQAYCYNNCCRDVIKFALSAFKLRTFQAHLTFDNCFKYLFVECEFLESPSSETDFILVIFHISNSFNKMTSHF